MEGVVKKMLRIDMAAKSAREEEIGANYKGLGGRGLTGHIVFHEVPPSADPLGRENKLIFAAGILAGTAVPNNGRLSVGAKSPLTNGIKEANSGGAAAQKIARLGFQAIVIENCAEELTVVKVDRKGVTFIPASSVKGLGNYDLIENLKAAHGNNAASISIGPAGEMKLKTASVIVTTPDFKPRTAARGGLGAVMGSKNLKAIVIDDTGSEKMAVKDKAGLKEAASQLSTTILANPLVGVFKELGTPALVMLTQTLGCLPTKNYSSGQFAGVEKICGERMAEIIKSRSNSQNTHRCMSGCIVGCSNVYTDEKGEEIVSGLEYETIALNGSNCMISDLDTIARINRLCNDIGVDTMDVGAALAVGMEAGLLRWGDGTAALGLIEEIRKGTDRGLMIGNGCKFTGEKLGVKRIPHVKGQSLSGYDPRGLKGTGVTYSTSPMGADHTCGLVLPNPADPSYSPVSATGQTAPSQFIQIYMAALDSLGVCMMAGLPLLEAPGAEQYLVASVAATTGESLTQDYLIELGKKVLQTERAFNDTAGFTTKDDRLPEFFFKEQLTPGNNVFDVPENEIDKVNRFA
jgi:aldehyde:ferredoxin oxidoreductase